jgi:hypothetical protein
MSIQASPPHVPLYTSERRLDAPDFRKSTLLFLVKNVDDDFASSKTYGIRVAVEPEVYAAPLDRSSGIAGDRRAVTGNEEAGAQRDNARIDGHDTVSSLPTKRGRSRATSATVRRVRCCRHAQNTTGGGSFGRVMAMPMPMACRRRERRDKQRYGDESDCYRQV